MAEIPRIQGFRTQIAQAPSAATPNVSFGQQQRPEMEFQAAAQYQNTLGQVLDRISTAIFGQARGMAEQEGYQYVASRPATEEQLKAMVNGTGEMPDIGNPLNVFNAAVRKARAIEISAYAENEGRRIAADLLKKSETGAMDTEKAMSTLSAFTDGFTPRLAQVDPEASLKFRATMATIGNTVIDSISKRELRLTQIKNMAAADAAFDSQMQLITEMIMNADGKDPEIEKKIAAYRDNFFNNAAMTVSLEAAQQYQVRFSNEVEQAKGNLVANFVSESSNPALAYDQVRRGRTGNPYIDSLVSPTSASRFRVMDAARKQLAAVNSLQEQQSQLDARQAVSLEADLYDALSTNNRARVNEILQQMRVLDPSKYRKLKEEASGGGVFAQTDNAMVVADLEVRMNTLGKEPTVSDVSKYRGSLTQATFVRLVNAAKSANDAQIREMKDQAANRLQMAKGPVLNRDAARQRQEKQMGDLEYAFFQARIQDPNVNPFTWLNENFEKITKASAKASNDNLVNKVTSRPYKTIQAFDAAIRDAARTKNNDQVAELTRQRSELEQAIKEGLVDEKGNRK